MKTVGRLRFDSEEDNVGQEAAETAQTIARRGVRELNHQLKSNPASRRRQKQAIKKQYAAAKAGRTAGDTTAAAAERAAQATGAAAKKATEGAKKTAQFVQRHKKGFLIAGALLLTLSFLLSVLSSCSLMVQSLGASITASTYPSEDTEMTGAEATYAGMETELRQYLDTYESTHSYDKYQYELDSIEHDPYVLISLLSAMYPDGWTQAEVAGTLQTLFDRQYTLTETVTTETRYRTETRTGTRTVTDPVTGEVTEEEYEREVRVPYTYTICTVTLENFGLDHLPVYVLNEEQLSMYAVYIGSLGNRSDLFPDSAYVTRYVIQGYTDYEIPPEALEDEVFAAMMEEAEKYLGYPYVWGGASPETSFDCSGFVSWVVNHSGWNVGRLTAQGLRNICTLVSNPRPGDLVFFEHTYDSPETVTHVGIYAGDGWMIHAGDPISYIHFTDSSYHMSHLYGYGRLRG